MGKRLKDDRASVEKWILDGTPALPPSLQLRHFSPEMTPQDVQKSEPAYFHQLINIEDYPEFLDQARLLARYYLDVGVQNEKSAKPDSNFKSFEYTEEKFDARTEVFVR